MNMSFKMYSTIVLSESMYSSTVKVGSSVLGFWGSLLKQPTSNIEFVEMEK
jgi:hypothetical protein